MSQWLSKIPSRWPIFYTISGAFYTNWLKLHWHNGVFSLK